MKRYDQLRPYQHRIVDFGLEHEVAAIFVDMSLGKTISLLTLYKECKARGLLAPDEYALVIAPLRVARTVWHAEAEEWEHTRNLRVSRILGTAKQRVQAMLAPADIYVLNVENVVWFFNVALPQYVRKFGRMPWRMLVLDESSKFKHGSTQRFKALRPYIQNFKRRYLLTGTPRTKTLLNLWSQLYLLDRGERLGTSFNRFKERFFMSTDYERRTWEVREGASAYVENMIRDITIRMDADDWLSLPPIIENPVYVQLSEQDQDLYNELEQEMFVKLDEDRELLVFNSAVLTGKCHQFANGAVYYDPERRTDYHVVHDLKLDALEEILDECMGNVLIAYQYRHDLERIRARLHPMPVPTLKDDTEETVRQWNAGKLRVLAVHPSSAAHGLNLQFGGNTIVGFSLTWSSEDWLQLMYRLRRPGQTQDHISIIPIITSNTTDEAIRLSNQQGITSERGFLDSLNTYRWTKELLS